MRDKARIGSAFDAELSREVYADMKSANIKIEILLAILSDTVYNKDVLNYEQIVNMHVFAQKS